MARAWSRRSMEALVSVIMMVALALAGCALDESATPPAARPMPAFQYIFVIVMENSGYEDIIGSPNAPRINQLANQYGLATNYWGVAHPSEPNYIAMIGGDTFGVSDDNSYMVNALIAPNLATQLEAAKLTWKSYQQSLPNPGFQGETYPAASALYASKHNPFMNYLGAWPASERQATLARIVPATTLATDIASGVVPNLSFISPDLCHDMHGAPSCASGAALTQAGDSYVGSTVDMILSSSVWNAGNAAIIVTWDESDLGLSSGAPDIAHDGGHVPTLVITNHGPRGVKDNTPYNHYALLLTIEDAFRLSCLRNSCPATGGVSQMTPLFAK